MKKKEINKNRPNEKREGASQAGKSFWRRRYFFETLIFCFSFFLFSNSITNSYNLDDELVTINHRLTAKGVSAISEIFSSPYYQDESGYSYEYRPIVLTSFAIEHDIFGENPHWSHFWNVIFYALSCVLLYSILLFLFNGYSNLFSLAITLLFAAHPIHTEVVCSIKNRDEILGLLFSLLTLLTTLRYTRDKKTWLLPLVPIFFTLSLLSKLTFVSFAFIIPIALFLYTDVRLDLFLYFVVVLAVPALYFAQLGDYYTKLLLLLSILGISCLAFLIREKNSFKEKLIKYKERYLKRELYELLTAEDEPIDVPGFLKSITAVRSLFSWRLLMYMTIVTCVFVFSVYYGMGLLMTVSVAVAGIALFRKNGKTVWFAQCSAYIMLIYAFWFFKIYTELSYTSFVTIPLLYFSLYGKRNLFIPTLLALLAILIIGELHETETFITLLPFVLMMLASKFRRGWIGIGLIVALDLFAIKDLQPLSNKLKFLAPLFSSLLLLAAIYFKKWPSLGARLLLLFCIFSAGLFVKPDHKNFSIPDTINAIPSGTFIRQVDRPLDFVEQVVNPTDPVSIRLGTSMEILAHYLYKVVISFPMSFYYGYSYITPMKVTDGIPLISIALHGLLLVLVLFFWKRKKEISFGILIYISSIAIFSNFFQPVAGMLADRFLLVPSLGWCIIVVSLIFWIGRYYLPNTANPFQEIPKVLKYCFVVLLGIYSLIAFSRNTDWKDHLHLFRHDIKYVENSSQGHNLLALRLMKTSYEISDKGNQLAMRQEALSHFKRAIEIYPSFSNVAYDIGRVYSIFNYPDSALIFYKRAAVLNPKFPGSFIAAGEILFSQNKMDESRTYFEKIITLLPNDYTGYEKVSYICYVQQDYAKAIEINRDATINIPHDVRPFINIAKTFHTMNRDDSARYYINKALEIKPGNQEAVSLLKAYELTARQ